MALPGTPVLATAPPRAGACSTSATFLPKYAAFAAPFSPAGPEPITIRSYLARFTFPPRGTVWLRDSQQRFPIAGRVYQQNRRREGGKCFAAEPEATEET